MIRNPRLIIIATLGIMVLSSPAMAAYEYYTYDGYEPIVRAFTAISHIFKNNQMVLLAGVAAVIGMTVAGITFLVTSVSGAKGSIEMVFFPAIVGMALYLAMFTHTETLIVYDSHTNQFQSIPEVPVGVVYIASAINDIEVGMVDIIETAFGGFGSVQQAAGAYNILTASKFFEGGAFSAYVTTSLQAYTNDCVLYEMMVNPTGGLNPESLRTSSDFLPLFGQAVNPAIFTTYFDAASPNGENLSCTAAWAKLTPVLTQATTYSATINKACGAMGFGDDPFQLGKCRSLAEGFLQSPLGANVASASLESVARQALISRTIFEVVRDGSTLESMTLQANRTMTSKGIGSIVASNEWLPYFKAGMTAVSLGLIPIVAVFMATPLAGRSLSFIFGIFIFLAAWGIADAVATASGSIYTYKLFTAIRDTGLGLDTFINFPDYTTKMAAVFGTLRSMAVAFAGLISMMMVKFGGHFLAGIGSNIMGQMQGTGGDAGRMGLPEGRTSAMSSMISSVGVESWANNNSFGTMAGADSWGRQWTTEGYRAANAKASALGISLLSYGFQSQLGFNVGTDGGALSGTVAPDGSGFLNSNLDKSHGASIGGDKSNPALNVKPTNLGIIGAETSQAAEAASKQQLIRQSGVRSAAGKDLTSGVRSLLAASKGLEDHVNQGAQRGDSEAISLKEGFSAAHQQQESFAQSLATKHNLSTEQARMMAAQLTGGVQAGFNHRGGGFIGWAADAATGSSFNASIGAGYNLSATDRSKVADALQHTDGDDWKQANTVAKGHTAALDRARGSNYVQSSGAGQQSSEGVRASREQTRGASQNYQQAWTREESMRKTLETANKNGVMSKEKLDPELQQHLYDTFGQEKAENLLATAATAGPGREAAMEELRPALNDFVDKKVNNLFAGAVGTEVAHRGGEIEQTVGDKQAETQAKVGSVTPDQDYANNSANVETQAAAAGVAPGTKPAPVQTGNPVPSLGGFDYLANRIEAEGQAVVQPGKAGLETAQTEAKDNYKKDVEETSKGMAFAQEAGKEGVGVVQSGLRVMKGLGDELTAGPQRMNDIVKPALEHPDSPYSPKQSFGGETQSPTPQSPDETRATDPVAPPKGWR